jgi:hypothetical protein
MTRTGALLEDPACGLGTTVVAVVTPFALSVMVVVPAMLAGWIGASKGHGLVGVVLGALLSYLGVIIVMFLKPAARPDAEVTGSPGWWPDPHRRHEYRYFDGRTWTHHVSDDGAASIEA